MGNCNKTQKTSVEKLQKLIDDTKKPINERMKTEIKKKLEYINKPIYK